MNFREQIKLFTGETGRHDLVADFAGGDYTDKGAGVYINAGQEMLDRRFFRFLGADSVYKITLPQGTSKFPVPFVRTINSIWAKKSSDAQATKYRLCKKTPNQLLSKYNLDLDVVEQGEPVDYARTGGSITVVTSSGTVVSGDNLYYSAYNGVIEEESEFTPPVNISKGWYGFGVNAHPIELSGEDATFPVTESGFGALTYLYFITPMSLGADPPVDDSLGYPATVIFDLEFVEDGSVALTLLDTSFLRFVVTEEGEVDLSELPAGYFTSFAQFRKQGSYSVPLPLLSSQSFSLMANRDVSIKNIQIVPTSSLVSGQTISLSGEEVLISPPLNEETDIEVHGFFYTAPLTSPTDTNFWTEKHPYLLNLCAQYKHEISMSNMTRVRELLTVINEELRELNMDEIDEEDPDDGMYVEIEG